MTEAKSGGVGEDEGEIFVSSRADSIIALGRSHQLPLIESLN